MERQPHLISLYGEDAQRARLSMGLTQCDFGKLILGKSRAQVARYERCGQIISPQKIAKIYMDILHDADDHELTQSELIDKHTARRASSMATAATIYQTLADELAHIPVLASFFNQPWGQGETDNTDEGRNISFNLYEGMDQPETNVYLLLQEDGELLVNVTVRSEDSGKNASTDTLFELHVSIPDGTMSFGAENTPATSITHDDLIEQLQVFRDILEA